MLKWLFEDKPPEFDAPMYMHERNINEVVKYCEKLNIGPNDLNELLELSGKVQKAIDNDMVKWQCRIVDNEKHFKLNERWCDDEFFGQ